MINNKQLQTIALLGTLLCLTAVAIGAFGAHAFKEILITHQREDVFDLANRYQFYHGLALILIAVLFGGAESMPNLSVVSGLMFVGSLIFTISLYLLALLNLSWLGAVTPIGGALLIASWGLLAIKIVKYRT